MGDIRNSWRFDLLINRLVKPSDYIKKLHRFQD